MHVQRVIISLYRVHSLRIMHLSAKGRVTPSFCPQALPQPALFAGAQRWQGTAMEGSALPAVSGVRAAVRWLLDPEGREHVGNRGEPGQELGLGRD